jgi:hypothetical protein
MLKKCVFTVLFITIGLTGASFGAQQEFIEGMAIQPTGWMKTTDGIEMGVDHYGKDWALIRQALEAVRPKEKSTVSSPDRWSTTGTFGDFDFSETISKTAANKIHYHAAVKHASGVQTSQLAFVITLPFKLYQGKSVECDGKKINLPQKYSKEFLLTSDRMKSLVIQTENGRLVIRHSKGIIIQDPRRYNEIYEQYIIRLSFSPEAGMIKDSSIDLDIELQPYQTEPISIAGQANMGLADEVPADGKGGWTDQGPENDIRMLPVGLKRFGGVLFDILDAKNNGRKSCLVFSGPERSYFLKSVSIPVPNKTVSYLYFLHAIAWAPNDYAKVGQVRVDYADGTFENIDVMFDNDVSNWWNVLPTKGADVVWTATNNSAAIGLYLARFAVQSKPITKLTLEGTGKAVWMVVGISGGQAVPRLFIPNPIFTVAGEAWKPYTYDLTVKPGSIMDFSFLNHAPAGKFGRVIVNKAGHFAFTGAPETNVRFYGGNLCFSANSQDKKACEYLAENVARMGYNTIRFHHFDCGIAGRNIKNDPLDSNEHDKLDYLFFCLKQKGIYITIDLYSIRAIGAGLIPEAPGEVTQDLKALIPVSESAFANWQAYTRKLLTHVNPYTKLAWKDDPALFAICVDNEDNLTFWWDEWPYVQQLYNKKFNEWLSRKKMLSSDANNRSAAFNEFLTELQLTAYKRCRDFIRSLGCRALLSDVNFLNDALTQAVRPHLDYVDNHMYFAVPGPIHRHESLPARNFQANNLDSSYRASLARGMFHSRVFGKPYMITEFNMAFPNRYRGESGLIMGAYGALQNWDGLYRFAYSHTAGNTQGVGATIWMELTQDPINMISERIGILLFRRGDISPAGKAVALTLTAPEMLKYNGDPLYDDFTDLGLCRRIGQWDFENPGAVKPEPLLAAVGFANTSPVQGVPYRRLTKSNVKSLLQQGQPSSGWITSDTGQIALDPKIGQMTVVTDKTECFALGKKKTLVGKIVTVQNHGDFSVVCVTGMDDKPLSASRHLLVFHLTDSTNTLARFYDRERTIIEDWGKLPQLVRRDSAAVTLNLGNIRKAKAWAITMSGERKNEIPAKVTGGSVELTVDTNQPTGGCMSYEIVLE